MKQQGEREPCPRKQSLLDDYRRATELYVSRLQELEARMATAPKAQYDRLREGVENARLESERARLDLESHIRAHGC